MNITDLFDRMASELAPSGAVESGDGAGRTLCVGGSPFARLTATGAEVYLPEGAPAREDALRRWLVQPVGPEWVAVPEDDAASWPPLFEQALHVVRDAH